MEFLVGKKTGKIPLIPEETTGVAGIVELVLMVLAFLVLCGWAYA